MTNEQATLPSGGAAPRGRTPRRRAPRAAAILALIAAIAAVFGVGLPTVSAQEIGPSQLEVHRVDARGDQTEIRAIADDYGLQTASVIENGSSVDPVVSGLAAGVERQIVFVLDTGERMRGGDALGEAVTALADAIPSLGSSTEVAVITAGNSAITVVPMTDDLNAAAAAVREIGFSEDSALIDGFDKAVGLLAEPSQPGVNEVVQTVVVVAGGVDEGSFALTGPGQGGMIRRGAQLVTIQYAGGDPVLDTVMGQTGGIRLSAVGATDLVPALERAVTAANDRYVISYAGQSEITSRGDVTVAIGPASDAISYDGGELSIRSVALAPAPQEATTGAFQFFETQTGYYVTLLLAFLGIGLAIFMIGSMFASGETALDGLIARYSTGEDELDDEESAIVQTALVQRAVEMSESFAEDRGFLNKIEEMLERAKLPLRPGEAITIFMAGVVLAFALGFFVLGGLVGSVVMAFIVGVGMVVGVRMRARKRMRKFEQQLPDALQLLAGTLRAGYSLPQGLEAVSKEAEDPMGYELRRVMTEARLGREMEEALASAAERLNSPDFAWAVMAISIQREVGGNLNELLLTVADTMIQRERLKGEINTLTAEGKMSAILLGGLPPGLGLVMWVMNPEYINKLFEETLGNIFLGLGIVAALVGFAWMKKVITIDV